LVRFEGEKRGFKPRKQRREEDQDRDGNQKKGESRNRHSLSRQRWSARSSSGKIVGLLII
jgi:hypothetical protein